MIRFAAVGTRWVIALATAVARRATYRATARRSRAAAPWGLASNATKRVTSPGIVPTEEVNRERTVAIRTDGNLADRYLVYRYLVSLDRNDFPGLSSYFQDFPVAAEETGEASATIATTSAILPANVPRDPVAAAEVVEAEESEVVARRNATSVKDSVCYSKPRT